MRRICLDEGLREELKWSHPAYTFDGKNIVILGAFKGDFHISFFNASLLKDPENLLTKRGESTRVASVISFTSSDAVKTLEPSIRAYIQEAIANEKAGLKPAKVEVALELPDELVDALDNDPELTEAFYKLTPGRQRGYAMTIGQAKQSETRRARIEKYRDKIFAGKGFQDR